MIMRYLIVQTAFLGDAILAEPLVETIKENEPRAFVGVLVIPSNTEVFSLNPKVDTIIPYDKHGIDNGIVGFLKIVRIIKDYNFDCVISPHRSLRSSLISFLSGAKKRIGFRESEASVLYTDKVKRPSNIHEVEKNLRLIEPLGFKKIVKEIRLYWSEENKKFIEGVFEAHNIESADKVVVISPSSVWPTKRWLKEYYKEVAEELNKRGYRVILIGTKNDIQISSFIKGENKDIVDLTGKTGIKDLFYLIAWAKLLISNDSAPVHIASAFNTPTIEIYGPTVPEFGFYPLSEKHKIIQVENLPCRPCGKHGSVSCAQKHFRCMRDIKPQTVIDAALELL